MRSSVMPKRLTGLMGVLAVAVAISCSSPQVGHPPENSSKQVGSEQNQAVGPQYDSTHVYVDPGQLDAFVHSWLATFGGKSSAVALTDVTPTPSRTRSQLILSPIGTLSVFDFTTPVPFPFGTERTGWLMKDLDAGIEQARSAGASVVVAPFADPIGRDAIIQFPGGVSTQLYWHTTPPSYAPLATVPQNRLYLTADSVTPFLQSYLAFSGGKVSDDNPAADGALIGAPGTTFRAVHIQSPLGDTMVAVTDGHLAYPFGRETTGYAVSDLTDVVADARANGATVLVPPVTTAGGDTAILQFPGGYIAEFHTTRG